MSIAITFYPNIAKSNKETQAAIDNIMPVGSLGRHNK